MMRIVLFLATNLAVMLLVSVVFNLLGLQGILAQNGVDLNLQSLLIFCAVFGFGGAFVSLFLSKWLAKRGTGTYVIEQPRNRDDEAAKARLRSALRFAPRTTGPATGGGAEV